LGHIEVATYFGGVTLFDGKTVRAKHGVLVGDDGRIEWVGAHVRAPRRAGAAQAADSSGMTLTPGLIDGHVHLQFDGGPDTEAEGKDLKPGMATLKAANNARLHLSRGVTTVRDLGGMAGLSCEVGAAVESGLVLGARVLAVGQALTITGGHGHSLGVARQVDGADAVRKAVREEIRAGALAIKVIATGGVLTPGIGATFTAFTPQELEAAVDEAHKWDRGVAAHAIGAEGILNAVVAGVDSVEHCNEVTPEIVREMKARGTFRSPTICALRGIIDHPDQVPAYAVDKAKKMEARSIESHQRAIKGGVRHVCGTDAGTPFNPHGSAPQELVYMVDWGMSALAAMRAATANGAELLRLPDVGTIEAGKLADLVLYAANPADDISAVLSPAGVWKSGVAFTTG
jgi:imidazolonepropionase-like amidohydrolase